MVRAYLLWFSFTFHIFNGISFYFTFYFLFLCLSSAATFFVGSCAHFVSVCAREHECVSSFYLFCESCVILGFCLLIFLFDIFYYRYEIAKRKANNSRYRFNNVCKFPWARTAYTHTYWQRHIHTDPYYTHIHIDIQSNTTKKHSFANSQRLLVPLNCYWVFALIHYFYV